jgi:hypothetical protein
MAKVDPIDVRTVQQLRAMEPIAVGKIKADDVGTVYVALFVKSSQRWWDTLVVEVRRPRQRGPTTEELARFQDHYLGERRWAEIWVWRCTNGTRDLPPKQRRYTLTRLGMHGGHPS